MITRFAIFEGEIADGQDAAFRKDVRERLVPLWTSFPGCTDVRVSFSVARDAGAPAYPMVLAISYPDEATMTAALDSDARHRSKDVTGEIVAAYFNGRIHHHVTEADAYAPAAM